MTAGTMPRPAPEAERAVVPLLDLVARGAVDEDYALVARRRVSAGEPTARPSRHLLAGVGIVVFGLLIAVAAVQTARESTTDSASRALLVKRIDERRQTVSTQQSQITDLRRQNSDLAATSRRIGGTLTGAEADLAAQQRATGFRDVIGPGVQVTVNDNPDGDAAGRVRATDLRLLVNALWQAGAEAISLNGRRLTTLSAIVNASIAVQVNRGPVSPPYVVTAVGSLATLPGALTDTVTGAALGELADRFGFDVRTRTSTQVSVPTAPDSQLRLRAAQLVQPTPSSQDGVS